MEINGALQSKPLQGSGISGTSQASSVLSSDFETFLQMLTAQARYQDPLEPIDSSEYAAQLAQFSMVEQQVLSNELLTDIGTQSGSGGILQMAGWIGMEARTDAPVAFDGTPLTILPKIEPGADEAVLVAYTADGSVVDRRSISTSVQSIEWPGTDSTGAVLPNGTYRFAVESMQLGETIATTPAESYARILEARRNEKGAELILSGGSVVQPESISALRSVETEV